jgi:hypothetical protein
MQLSISLIHNCQYMWRKLLILALVLQLEMELQAQNTYNTIARDTIISVPSFPSRVYLLDGKKLNLPVMDFFMRDYPVAHDQIQLAMLTDQVAIVGYSVGGLFGLTGLLVYRQDSPLANNLLKMGGIGIGTGVVFHIFTGVFKKSAVRRYNHEVKGLYRNQNKAGLKLSAEPASVRISWTFR